MPITVQDIAKRIDHAALKTDVTGNGVIKEAALARLEGARALVVHPTNLPIIEPILKGTDVLAVPVCDFPHGRDLLTSRILNLTVLYNLLDPFDPKKEVDIVSSYQRLKDSDYKGFRTDTKDLIKVSIDHNGILKIILEVDELTEEQRATATKIIMDIVSNMQDADIFIKTKTGFAKEVKVQNPEACRQIIQLLNEGNMHGEGRGKIRVKASGGVGDFNALSKLVFDEGVDVVGASATKKILDEARTVLLGSPPENP